MVKFFEKTGKIEFMQVLKILPDKI